MFKPLTTIFLGAALLIGSAGHALAANVPPIGALSQRLGISNEQVQAELQAGKTPQQIAQKYGMSKAQYNRLVKKPNKKSSKKRVSKKVTKQKRARTVKRSKKTK